MPRDFLSNPIALEFCFGLALAYFIHWKALSAAWLRYLWLPGLILMAAGAAFARNNDTTGGIAPEVRYLVWGLPALLVTFSFIKMRFNSSRLTRILVPIGDASYSIYLTHPTIMIAFATLINLHVLRPVAYPIIYTLLFSALSLVLGLVIHYSVERPILACLRGGLRAKRQELPISAENGAGVVAPRDEAELILSGKKQI
jgi:peptidoglycan/LPS O-acetylase OafA/YrhL